MSGANPDPLGGMSLKEYLAPRPGEIDRSIPDKPSPPADAPKQSTPGWRGYVEAAGAGALGAAPFAAGAAAVPGLGLPTAGITLATGAAGGLLQHAIKQNAPEGTPEWVAPVAGALVGPWGRGVVQLAAGAARHPLNYLLGTAATHYVAGLPNLMDLSNHIYKSAMMGIGIPVARAVPDIGKKLWQGNVAPLVEMYGGAAGAEASRLYDKYMPSDPRTWLPDFSPIYNLLNPPPQPPAAEAEIPLRPPAQRPQLPRTGTRLEMD